MHQLAQLFRRVLGLLERLDHERGRRVVLVLERPACKLQRDHRVDQPLLRAVVQVADHAPALVVGGGDHACARCGELRPRPDVRDRGRDQLGERLDPCLRADRHRIGRPRGDDHRSPQAPLDDDRAADRGSRLQLAAVRRDRTRCLAVVVHPGRLAAPRDQADDVPASKGEPGADGHGIVELAPPRHHRGRLVLVEADQPRGVAFEQPPELLRDRGEDLRRGGFVRHERRHPAQGGLLVREATHLGPRLGVRDRRRDQLGELREPRLGAAREVARLLGVDEERAPHLSLDDDRATDRGAHSELLADEHRDRAGGACPVVFPGGPARRQDRRRKPVALERPHTPDLRVLTRGRPRRHGGQRPPGEVPDHPREVGAEQRPDLLGDGVEELARRHAPRDERRDAPQRRLLVRQPPDLRACLGVRDRCRDELREACDPRIRIRRERLVLDRRRDHHSPQAFVDDDRGAHR